MKPQTIKISWEQWQEKRSALRAISRKIAPDGLCRTCSSSDARLKRLYNGNRRPPPSPVGAGEKQTNENG